jgi:hypothetical protein
MQKILIRLKYYRENTFGYVNISYGRLIDTRKGNK